MPLMLDGMHATVWSTWKRKAATIAVVTGLITGITGSIIGISNAAPIVEPWWYASRGWVRVQQTIADQKSADANEKTVRILRGIQIDGANGKREATEGDIFKWEQELKKAVDDDSREKIAGQLRKLHDTKRSLDAQIDTLSKLSGQ